jgi:hypothetical protein
MPSEEIMLTRVLGKFRPTPSMTVSLLALVIALGSAGYAANGGAFILGGNNSASQRSLLAANFNGSALQLSNSSPTASATALRLTVVADHAPFGVNSTTKVANLNADYLDGLDSSTLTRALRVSYNLAAGATSAPITVPANRPVQLVGVTLTDAKGVGQASLLRFPGYIEWVGLHSHPTSMTSGISFTPGTTIVYIDYYQRVSVEVAGPDTIRVHNTSSITQSGSVTLTW